VQYAAISRIRIKEIKSLFSKPGTRIPKKQKNQIKRKIKRSSMGSPTPLVLAGKWWFQVNRANLLLVRRSRCPGQHLSPNNSAHSNCNVAKCWKDLNSVNMCLACRISITQWLHAALKRCEVNHKMTTFCLSVCAERAGPCSRHCPRSTSCHTQYMQSFFLSLRVEFCWIQSWVSQGCLVYSFESRVLLETNDEYLKDVFVFLREPL
jgi:hypothetical protein